MEQRLKACRELIAKGEHPQLTSKFCKSRSGAVAPGQCMEVYSPKNGPKKSVLDDYGVRCEVTINEGEAGIKGYTYWLCQHEDCTGNLIAGETAACIKTSTTTCQQWVRGKEPA